MKLILAILIIIIVVIVIYVSMRSGRSCGNRMRQERHIVESINKWSKQTPETPVENAQKNSQKKILTGSKGLTPEECSMDCQA